MFCQLYLPLAATNEANVSDMIALIGLDASREDRGAARRTLRIGRETILEQDTFTRDPVEVRRLDERAAVGPCVMLGRPGCAASDSAEPAVARNERRLIMNDDRIIARNAPV